MASSWPRLCGRCRHSRTLWRGLRERRRSLAWSRHYGLFPDMSDSIAAITDKKKEFSDETVLGYTTEEVYRVVSDVDNYKYFLPWCKDAVYTKYSPPRSIVRLVIGFPPLTEEYTALVLTKPNQSIRTISTDGQLFSHLENLWQFHPGPDTDTGPSTIVNFWVYFEFRSLIYARLGSVVFDEVARLMQYAFQRQCTELYGPDHLASSHSSRDQVKVQRAKAAGPLSHTPHKHSPSS